MPNSTDLLSVPSSQRNITVRPVAYGDLAEMAELFAGAFADETPDRQLRRRVQMVRCLYWAWKPLAFLSRRFRNLFNVYVGRLDGKLMGFVQLSHPSQATAHLDYIAVSSPYRRQGWGAKLLAAVLQQAVDPLHHSMLLETAFGNEAVRLYEIAGFQKMLSIAVCEKKASAPRPGTGCEFAYSIRPVRRGDEQQIRTLHKEVLPAEARTVIPWESGLCPGQLQLWLDWLKNRLMGQSRKRYVIQQGGSVIAHFTLYLYPRTLNQHVSFTLAPACEKLRHCLMARALAMLPLWPEAVITTACYSNTDKEMVLSELGFTVKERYWLMHRPGS